jgi:hypothetical protein
MLKKLFENIKEEISKQNGIYQTEWYSEFLYQFDEFVNFVDNNNVKVKEVYKSEVDEHRWYGTQFIVWEIKHKDEIIYIGARVVTQSYSEMQSIKDICWSIDKLSFMKPKEITTIVYEELMD